MSDRSVLGGEGGIGGPYAGGGGGAGGYLEVPESSTTFESLINRDVIAITANSVNTGQNNTFLDSSANNITITRDGTTTQGSFTPYSPAGWSGYFDGTGDELTIANNPVFNFESGNFTAECWFNLTADAAADADNNRSAFLLGPGQLTNSEAWLLTLGGNSTTSGASILFQARSTNGTPTQLTYNFTFVKGTWYHVAVTRSSNTLSMYINGQLVAQNTNWTLNVNSGGAIFRIGRRAVSSNYEHYFPGYISNLRVVKGTALYTADFTPPTQPLTAVAGTSLLTLQDNRFIDRSTNNFAITRFGDTRITAFSPFLPAVLYDAATHGGSAFFIGTGTGLLTASNSALSIGTEDFTMEAWVYPTSTATWQQVIGPTYGTNNIALLIQSGVTLIAYAAGSVLTWSNIVGQFQWNHVVLTRQSGVVKLYHNGVEFATTATFSNSMDDTVYSIGRRVAGGELFSGHISGARVVKGTAVYTANFTPPTAPVTSVTNTSLLLNFTNAAIADVSGKNNIETVNGAQVSTSIAKHGIGSMFFDGVDDYLLIANNPNLILAGGPWTAECWIYPSGNYTIHRAVFGKRASGAGTTSYEGYLDISTGYISFYNGTTYKSSVTPTANQWSHCAWVYTGTNIQIYLNGVSVLNTAVTITEVNEPVTIGGLRGLNEFFAGYIDDFRITKGVARYTGTFTPPTEIYPAPIVVQPSGDGADGDALQAGDDNFYTGGAGGGSSTTVAGGGGGVGLAGIVFSDVDLLNAATGGVKTSYTAGSVEYVVHTFTTSSTFTPTTGLNVEYLVVAGGGGGGVIGGGGGGGGAITGNVLLINESYSIVIGGGGSSSTSTVNGTNGSDSSAFGQTAIGGGAGGRHVGSTVSTAGSNGGSGGGGADNGTAGGAGTAGQGNAGGTGVTGIPASQRIGGGGGGAGQAGSAWNVNNGQGGDGIQSSIDGTNLYYAGGGGAGGYLSSTAGNGGLGGGGGGSVASGTAGTGGGSARNAGANGTVGANLRGGAGGQNTGGGAGGDSWSAPTIAVNGGSGIVVIRYARYGGGLPTVLGGAVDSDGQGGSLGADGSDGNGGLYGGGGAGTTNSVVDPTVGNGARGALAIYWFAPEYPDGANAPSVISLNETTTDFQFQINFVPEPAKVLDSYIVDVTAEESASLTNSIPKYTDFDYNIVQSITSINVQNKSAESVYVSAGYLTVKTNESDHEMMLVNDDPRQLATGTNLAYQSIQKITPENDPRRITVRLLNYVVGVTGEGALVPTQIQTWF
jgi:hypothetical protein